MDSASERRTLLWIRSHRRTLVTAALLVVPILVALTLLISPQRRAIGVAKVELLGLRAVKLELPLLEALLRARDAQGVTGRLPADVRAGVDRRLADLASFSRGEGAALGLGAGVSELERAWADAKANGRSGKLDAPAMQAAQLVRRTGEGSSIAVDADTVVANISDAFGVHLVPALERLNRAKLSAYGLARDGHATIADRVRLARRQGEIEPAFSAAAVDLAQTGRLDPELQQQLERHVPLLAGLFRDWTRKLDDVILPSHARATPAAFLATSDRLERELGLTIGQMILALEPYVVHRAARARWTIAVECLGALLLLALELSLLRRFAAISQARSQAELLDARHRAEALAAELGRQSATHALARSEAQFQAVFDGSPVGVALIAADGTLVKANRAMQRRFDPLDTALFGVGHSEFAALFTGEIDSFGLELERPAGDGRNECFEASLSLIRDDADEPLAAMAIVNDVTARRRLESSLRHQATHDSLCAVPNRAALIARLEVMLAAGARPDGWLLFVDLDGFKFVNDTLGHLIGDRVLIETAGRIGRLVQATHLFARLGGDEFAILLDGPAGRADISLFMANVIATVGQAIELDGRTVRVTASIGAVRIDGEAANVQSLLRHADAAMYRAKANGRSRFAFFDASMQTRVTRDLAIAVRLPHAIERGAIDVAYQKIVSLHSGKLHALEALVRWTDRDLGPVSPAEFLPQAIRCGTMLPLGRHVIGQAVRQFASWRRTGAIAPDTRLNVNVSTHEIVQADLAPFLESILAEAQIDPQFLTLELTENVLLTGDDAPRSLRNLKSVGVRLAVDDFGTGFATLDYLQRYPFDELKIDRSFVAGADGLTASEPIVAMVVALGRTLGMSVVAEGIETAAQAARLRALGCDLGQGYLLGRPLAASAFAEGLESLATRTG
jgi:diguanylate cyclase (GGDEF)-like protein